MIVHRIENNFYNYRFPEEEGFRYGFNLYALVDGDKVLLIDSAFRTQVKKVRKDLQSKDLKLSHVLLTHFHPDHVNGLVALDPDTVVLGSPEYKKTITKEIPQPVTPISFGEVFQFGNFKLAFLPAPGHSACSILIDINGRYLHVGDNLMSRYDNKAILPWVEFAHIEQHISSLEMLRDMKRDRLILSHGPELCSKAAILQAIEDRLFYLKTVLQSGGKCTWEEAVSGCSCQFVGKEFFDALADKSAD
ncbi:MAG: MBL fold metallo-hydrolase [bacterium]|nr:MBL fold metallo-hydrolase [bacterium]